jgi:NAD(P)-dependent dehydrogenase (short-subunit alcohol dehydrogenase family)
MDPSKVTLITGASSGSGRRIAVHLSRSRRLMLHGRDRARLLETRDLCERPAEHLMWDFDLRRGDHIEGALEPLLRVNQLAIENFVHCAGTLKIQPLRLLDRGSAQEILDVNFMAALEILRLLVRPKINAKHLRGVVLISSTASRFGARGFSAYCASKGALDAFMRAAAVELAPRVRVNSVLPGATRSAMTAAMLSDTELRDRMEADYPLGIGDPDDVAWAVEFLLSDKSRWITGQEFVVDGGRTANISA